MHNCLHSFYSNLLTDQQRLLLALLLNLLIQSAEHVAVLILLCFFPLRLDLSLVVVFCVYNERVIVELAPAIR